MSSGVDWPQLTQASRAFIFCSLFSISSMSPWKLIRLIRAGYVILIWVRSGDGWFNSTVKTCITPLCSVFYWRSIFQQLSKIIIDTPKSVHIYSVTLLNPFSALFPFFKINAGPLDGKKSSPLCHEIQEGWGSWKDVWKKDKVNLHPNSIWLCHHGGHRCVIIVWTGVWHL